MTVAHLKRLFSLKDIRKGERKEWVEHVNSILMDQVPYDSEVRDTNPE